MDNILYMKDFFKIFEAKKDQDRLDRGNEPSFFEIYEIPFIKELVKESDMDYYLKSNADKELLAFDIFYAIWAYTLDYNDDTDYIHYLNTLLRDNNFEAGRGLTQSVINGDDNEDEDYEKARLIYKVLVLIGEEIYNKTKDVKND